MRIRATLARCAARIVAVGLLLFVTLPSQAALIVTAGSTAVAAGGSGSIDVTLTNTGPSSVTVGAFSFGLSTASANISFTGATTSTASPYIFDGNSLFGPNIDTTVGATLIASDLDSDPAGATVAAGATVGLGHVLFNVASGAPAGPVAITVTPFPTTSLSDPLGGNLAIDTLVPGTITVTRSTAAVPEPSTLLLAGLGWPAAWLLRRRRAAKTPTRVGSRLRGRLGS
jgi:hypothetical protein